ATPHQTAVGSICQKSAQFSVLDHAVQIGQPELGGEGQNLLSMIVCKWPGHHYDRLSLSSRQRECASRCAGSRTSMNRSLTPRVGAAASSCFAAIAENGSSGW